MRAAAELRAAFADVAEARAVLIRLADLLDRIDTDTNEAAQGGTKTKSKRRPIG
jgi:hypothetical protein